MSGIPVFGRRAAPTPSFTDRRIEKERGSRHERGLDSKWVRVRAAYAKKHPFCEECARRGIVRVLDDVDHIIPRRHGGTNKHENLQSLCKPCHLSVKALLERLAEDYGDIQLLMVWCREPEKRPGRYRYVCKEA